VFGTYGPFWVMFGAFETIYAASVPAVRLNDAICLFLAVFAVISFYLAIASLRTDLVLTVIIWLIFTGLVVLSVGAGANNVDITEAGGVIVLIFAILAWYLGTVTETLEAMRICRQAGYRQFVSHRSGETEDSFIADLAVGTGCGHLKSGAPARGERTAKYNRLLEIAAGAPGLRYGMS
jgi:hypothetical protein